MGVRVSVRFTERSSLFFQISTFPQIKRKWIPLKKLGTVFRAMKNLYFWKDCSNLCPESSTINQQITFKNCALNLQKTLAIWAKIQVLKNLPAKTLWSGGGDPASFQNFLDHREKIRSKYKHLISFKKWNKNSKTCISSNFFRYFFKGTQFLRKRRHFIEFSAKSRRFALAAGKLSESQRKTTASGPKYRQ